MNIGLAELAAVCGIAFLSGACAGILWSIRDTERFVSETVDRCKETFLREALEDARCVSPGEVVTRRPRLFIVRKEVER